MLQAGNRWHCSLTSECPAQTLPDPPDQPGRDSGLITKGNHHQAVVVISASAQGKTLCPSFSIVAVLSVLFGPLPPDRPLHLSSSLNHPAPFRHLFFLPPALGLAQDPATAGPENSFIQQPQGLLGDFGCKPRAARRGLRSTGPSGVGSRAAWGGETARQIQPESNGPPPACHNSFPDRPAGRARVYPAQAGSTSRQPEIPREQSSWARAARQPATPRVWGFGARARTQF